MPPEQSTHAPNDNLHELFHRPSTVPIAGVACYVYKIAFEQFPNAIAVGEWWNGNPFTLEALRQLTAEETLVSTALLSLIAGSVKVARGDTPASKLPFLQPAEVRQLPVVALADAIIVILNENADFFTQMLPSMLSAARSLMSIGGQLRNASSAPATDAQTSHDTPLQS